MTEAIYYCKSWSSHGKRPQSPLGPDEARARHDRGDEYTVLIGDPMRPRAYIETLLSRNYVCCTFLDEHLRPKTYCIFTAEAAERLFLAQSMTRRFKDETDEVIFAWSLKLSQDGQVVAVESDLLAGTRSIGTGQFKVDSFYIDRPAFGHYDDILKFGPGGQFHPNLDLPKA